MLSSNLLFLVAAATQEFGEAFRLYSNAFEGVFSTMAFDYFPNTLNLVLRTPNVLYLLPQTSYQTDGLNINMNRSIFTNYFPYINPGFNLMYRTDEQDAVLLQHPPQEPHVFTKSHGLRALGGSFSKPVPSSRTIQGCYSTVAQDLRVNVTVYSNGELDAQLHATIRASPSSTSYSQVLFCNATLASDNTIVADGWSKEQYPYISAPWTLTHRGGCRPSMTLLLGNGLEYPLQREQVCKPVTTCYQ